MQIDFWHMLDIAIDDQNKFMRLKFLNCIHRGKYGAYYYFIKKSLGRNV